MFNKIIVKFCGISHQQYPLSPSSHMMKSIILIQGLQYLALLFPNDGWGLWNYSDGHFKLIQQTCQVILGSSYVLQIPQLAYVLSIIMISIMLLILVLLIIEIPTTLNGMLFYSFMSLNHIFQLPLLYLFIGQITDFQIERFIINLIGIVLLSFYIFFTQYFIRSYSFQPINELQVRYNIISPLTYCLNILIIGLLHINLQNNDTLLYLVIAILNAQFILKIQQQLYRPKLHKFHIQIYTVLEVITLLISVNVISKNTIIKQDTILVYFLICGSFSYFMSRESTSVILSTQQILNYQRLLTKNRNSIEYLKIYQLFVQHQQQCQSNCVKIFNLDTIFKPLIQCILIKALLNEQILLFYVSFLGQYCKKPLLAYVELMKYDKISDQQSYYFKSIKYFIFKYLQILIKKQQSITDQKELELVSILNSITLEQNQLPKIMEIIDMKIRIWSEQIKGFQSIYDFHNLILQQSSKLQEFQQNFKLSFNLRELEHLNLNANVIELKVVSIYFCAVMNDYYNCYLCELKIQQIYNYETISQNEIINNSKLVDNQMVIIQISLVQNFGMILNKEKSIVSQFFGYESESFRQIQYINQLMPVFFGEIHDKLLANYLRVTKSKFFQSFNQIFTQQKNGFIENKYLKIDHNFSYHHDYVLMGAMSSIKSSSDFILFDEQGKIIGMTSTFYHDIINNYDPNFSVNKMCSLYIHIFLPQICKMMKQAEQNFEQQVQEYTLLLTHKNFEKVNQDWLQIYSSQNSISSKKGTKKFQRLLEKQDSVNQFVSELEQNQNNFNNPKYIMKYGIKYETVGYEDYKKSYYVLEIHELRRKDLFDYSQNFQTNSASIQNNNTNLEFNYKRDSNSNFNYSQAEIDEQELNEITPIKCGMRFDTLALKKQTNTKYQPIQESLIKLQPIDSYRESMSYGPISQRANFISPTAKQYQLEELLEKEFEAPPIENYSQQMGMEMEDQSQNREVVSSEKQVRSNQILQVMQKSKNIIDHKEEYGAQQSKSSTTSHSSSLSAIQLIKKFQQNTKIIKSLQSVLILYVIISALLISFIIIHIEIIKGNTNQLQTTIENISGPMLLSRYYCKLFAYAWSMAFNSFQIINSSDYIINTYTVQLGQMHSVQQELLDKIYLIYIDIEEQGQLSSIKLDLLYETSYDVSFTYFINFLKNVASTIYEAEHYKANNVTQLINENYANDVLRLRYNFRNVFTINAKLIGTFNKIFFQQLDDGVSQTATLIFIEISLYLILFLISLWYWKDVQIYIQRIVLLMGKLQEQQANELIVRLSFLKETLQQSSGFYCWKKQNYHQLGYMPLNQLGVERLSSQSRVLREYKLNQGINQQQQQQQKKKNTLNISLNSRIQNSKISISLTSLISAMMYLIIVLYLSGGYIMVNEQAKSIKPTQEMVMNYINFTTNLDVLITTGLVIKTQSFLYNAFVHFGIYSQTKMNSFRDPEQSVLMKFFELYPIYDENLTSIYKDIQRSSRIKDTEILFNLFSQNLCTVAEVDQVVRFCNMDDTFIADHGQYTFLDDNLEYLSSGIIGVVSRINNLITVYYDVEVQLQYYNPNKTFVLEQIYTQEFNNVFMEHFIDTVEATTLFLDLISAQLITIMNQDLQYLNYYYGICGSILALAFVLTVIIWIVKTNSNLIKTRIILVNLPIEILTEPHTLSMLKELQ